MLLFCAVAVASVGCAKSMRIGGESIDAGQGEGGDAASNAEPSPCPELRVDPDYVSLERVPRVSASVLFLVDRSLTMSCNTPADGQTSEECEENPVQRSADLPSKWQMTIEALGEIFEQLATADSHTRVGLMFYGIDIADSCETYPDPIMGGVQVDRLDDRQIEILDRVLSLAYPGCEIPLIDATLDAYRYMYESWGYGCGSPPCGAPGRRFVVLMTDGGEICGEPDFVLSTCCWQTPHIDRFLHDEVRRAVEENIRTLVVALPGSESARGFLSELAYQGGAATDEESCTHGDSDASTGDCQIEAASKQELVSGLSRALAESAGLPRSCRLPVRWPSSDFWSDLISVLFTRPDQEPLCIPKDDSLPCDGGANGWQFARSPMGSIDSDTVVLCGEPCDLILNEREPIQIEFLFARRGM